MIIEDYVSFEISELLKEKGMNKSCFNHYVQKNNNDGTSEAVTVCTLQMAMKWLRRVHNVNIDIASIWNQKRFEYQVFVVTPENAKQCYVDDKIYLGYEEAVEAGIKYSLENLI